MTYTYIHKCFFMAKAKGKGGASSMKITFGKRKSGRSQKSWGPKAQKPKKYRGQGR